MDFYKYSPHKNQIFCILEAALEYLISILMTGSYLAALTSHLGMSDSLAGIISSFVSLGCLFQLLSGFLKRKRVKGIVTVLSMVNQFLFLLLYIIPLMTRNGIVPFVAIIFLAYLIYNIIHPLKINWLMSWVDDKQRGIFTSKKEIVSLISGMIFSFAMGTMIDHFSLRGKLETAFVFCGITLGGLMLLHTLTMVLSVEIPVVSAEEGNISPYREILCTLQDKNVIKVTVLFVLVCEWYLHIWRYMRNTVLKKAVWKDSEQIISFFCEHVLNGIDNWAD